MKMKDKKAEQAAAKEEHRERLKSKRKRGVSLEREEPALFSKPIILIVCEGENTETSYFRQFRLSTATILSVGKGYNTVSLVKEAISLAEKERYEQVWCVFDKDDFPHEDFNKAIDLAGRHHLGVAYSNQAFEYWIILHFEDHQGGGMHRRDYNKKINGFLKPFGTAYDDGNKIITEEIFELLDGIDEKTREERKLSAIKRAKRNYDRSDHRNPAKEESSTTVFRLVEELLNYK